MVVSQRTRAEDAPIRLEDLKREASNTENSLRNERDPLRVIINIENMIQRSAELAEFYEFFVRHMLLKYIVVLLKRSDVTNTSTATRIKEFFAFVLDFASRNIEKDEAGMIELMIRITARNSNFFARYDTDPEDEDDAMNVEEVEIPRNAIHYRGKYSKPHKMLDDIYTKFLRAKGHQPIVERLRDRETSLIVVRQCLRLLQNVCEYLPLSFRSVVDEAKEMITARIVNCTDEEFKNEEKKVISDIQIQMEALLSYYYDAPMPQDWSLEFGLAVAYKYFTSSSLEKRLWGLNDISSYISESVKKHQTESPNMARNMIQWIKQHNIIEHLYGSNLHQQLLKRSSEIARFLSYSHALDNRELGIIWEASKGHESVTHHIYRTISEFSVDLGHEQMEYLFGKLSEIPFHQYDVITVGLAKSLTQHAIEIEASSNTKPRKCWFGLDLFWDIIQDESTASAEVQTAVMATLVQFLSWEECYLQRVPIMEKVLHNLSQSKSVPRSLHILDNILNTYQSDDSRRNGDSVAKTIS